MKNIITYKFKYICDNSNIILECIKDYNKILKYTYNRILKNNLTSTKELTLAQKEINNIFLDSHFKNSAIYEAKALIVSKNKSVCFGKKFYKEYIKGNITKDELKLQRLIPLTSIGEANNRGNRKFKIMSTSEIVFKPNKNTHIILNIISHKNRNKDINKLIELQNNKALPITYKLDREYIYISFDLNQVREVKSYNKVNNRIFAIDMNPNYLGYSVIDWKGEMKYKIIDSGVISIKDLNDHDNSLKGKGYNSGSKLKKYLSNKRKFEVSQITIFLTKLAKHYHCELFTVEDLSIKHKDNSKGTNYNKLVNNQWCRQKFIQILEKHCKLNDITLQKVIPSYSSFIGNLIFRKENLPDMILSSMEISRRGYEFKLQYLDKTKSIKKNIVFPEVHVVKDRINHALEVLKYSETWNSLKDLYYSIKNAKLKYRVLLEDLTNFQVSSILHIKSYLDLYKFRNINI